MFNLLVSGAGWPPNRKDFLGSRVFEHTSDDIRERFVTNGSIDFESLKNFPAIFVEEGTDSEVARIGKINVVHQKGRDYRLEYQFDQTVPVILNRNLMEMAPALGIEDFEFHRTHWAVKSADLFHILFKANAAQILHPKVFSINRTANSSGRVAVMMPFDSSFGPVYKTLKSAIEDAGKVCVRADDIWVNDAIIQDIVDLIVQSECVVCDLSGKNANVFYEVGIAHTIGQNTILIAQRIEDVPFDLRHLRTITYLNNGEGLAELNQRVIARLRTVTET